MDVPAEKYPFHHHQSIQVRFNDIDVLGHVNNTIYFEYMDFGKAQYITRVLGRHFDYVKEALVIVNVNCEFYHITAYGEPLEVLTRVDEIGQCSVAFEQRVINSHTNEVKCIARTVMVGFSLEKGTKMEITDDVRAEIGRFEGRDFPKHAAFRS